ncbi:MAG: site-specific DNA-methyltransferase, partial [Chloroflexi bacterium]|nr:site-specific DNA-methyltransferase [Chloroflexota bacterium]
MNTLASYAFDYDCSCREKSLVLHADCFEWMKRMPEASIHAIVTDPPYGVKEYEPDQLEKRTNGNGGVWRIPPSYDGHKRSPLPRFTALNQSERGQISEYFTEWATLTNRVLLPGGHIFIASNAFLAQIVFSAIAAQGLEYRGQIIRLVRTIR